MTQLELDAITRDISREVIDLLEKTSTPPLPLYYEKAFMDVASKRGKEIESKLAAVMTHADQQSSVNLEASLGFAHEALHEYSETASKLKEMMLDNDIVLDLKSLEADDFIPASMLDELRNNYSGLADEIKKAEVTIMKLESDLEKIETDSFIDRLTRLRSPALLKRQLEQILEVGYNRNLDLWVALFAIDDYEQMKEKYGYVVMEKVILFLSKSLQGTIRSDNKIYRYNEKHNMEGVFCVVFNRMDRQGAYLAAGRVRGRVEASKLVYAEKVIGVTLSAVIVPHKAGDSYQLLCTRAEKALESIELKDKNSIYVIED